MLESFLFCFTLSLKIQTFQCADLAIKSLNTGYAPLHALASSISAVNISSKVYFPQPDLKNALMIFSAVGI